MAVQCNIGQRGTIARLIAGGVVESAGWLLIVLRLTNLMDGGWALWVGGAMVTIGFAVILTGVLKWCPVRALGIDTPL